MQYFVAKYNVNRCHISAYGYKLIDIALFCILYPTCIEVYTPDACIETMHVQ